jgi:hypothetical protein
VREVEWIEEWPLGRGRADASGTVADLLTGGPYPSLSPPEVPPLAVVNEILGTCGGGGMNGGRRWRPFALSAGEYGELVNDLVASCGFTIAEVPPWVTSGEDWHVWLMERRRGVPAGQQRQLSRRARDLISGTVCVIHPVMTRRAGLLMRTTQSITINYQMR